MTSALYGITAKVLDQVEGIAELPVVPWGSPVPFFGNLETARVATVGINPSNREFVDAEGNELVGDARRLPTLSSLGISSWADATSVHIREILRACAKYFQNQPYDRWFKVLDYVLSKAPASFYGPQPTACHIDLVPYATWIKWGTIGGTERRALLDVSREAIAMYLRSSGVSLLILNGQSVVENFEIAAGVSLDGRVEPSLSLPRRAADVVGITYAGWLEDYAGYDLGRPVRVVGYNHNLQSSYGVTGALLVRIREWIAREFEAHG